MKIFLVYNARSGKHAEGDPLQAIESALAEAGRAHEVVRIDPKKGMASTVAEAARRAAEEGGVLAGAGGDGTLNSVAQAAWQADCAFGAIPLGTFNYFAREHQIPLEPGAAAAALAAGVERPIQVGLLNDRLFLVNASLGFYPRLLEDREAFKSQYGRRRWVAMLAALWTLFTRSQPRLVLRIAPENGEARLARVSTLFVGNNPLQLERLGIPEAQAVEKGCLAAIRVRPASIARLIDILLYGAIGRLKAADGVEAFSFRELEVAPLRPRRRPLLLKAAVDGEQLRLPLPLVFRVAPRPLRLVAPPEPAPAAGPASNP